MCAETGRVAAVSVFIFFFLHGCSCQDAEDALLLLVVASAELYPHRRRGKTEVRDRVSGSPASCCTERNKN